MTATSNSNPISTTSWIRSHIYKIIVFVVIILIALQYAFSVIFEQNRLEPLFSIGGGGKHTLSSESQHHTQDFIQFHNNYTNVSEITSNNNSRMCPLIPPNLVGHIKVSTEKINMNELSSKLSSIVETGGLSHPNECIAKESVAIIIPYRNREIHLAILLSNLHPFLHKQQKDYGIFVIEQSGTGSFNRAMLMNIGFKEALKLRNYTCFIFHDVDLLPEDDRNLYSCPEQPRHMSVAIDIFKYKLPYKDIFGGVSALRREHFEKVNGFSNAFWGWGGEDDDMANRIKFHHLFISRYKSNIAHYKMLSHKKEKASPSRYKNLYTGQSRFRTDGLNSLKYHVISKELRPLYTWILVDIGGPSSS